MSSISTDIDSTGKTDANFMATHPEYSVPINNNEPRYTSRDLVPLVTKKKKKELGSPPNLITEKRQYKMWDTGVPVPVNESNSTVVIIIRRYHQKGVPLATFERMVDYVDRAMDNSDKNNNAPRKPLVLDVHNNGPLSSKRGGAGGDPDNYFLAYYPNNKAVALRLLQALYLTHGEEHSALVQALCSPDIIEREMPSAKSRALVACYSGAGTDGNNKYSRNDVGEWEYTYDIDDLEKCFGQYLYVQQCHTNMDAMYGY